MSNNLIEAGYIRIKSNITDQDRFVDVLIDVESDSIIEPYFFLYDYGQKARTLGYSLPVEAMNHKEVIANTMSFMGTYIPSLNHILKYANSVYLPQLHPCEYVERYRGTVDMNDVATGSEDESEGDSMGHIYLMLKAGEISLQLYRRNSDITDPYNLLNPEDVIPLLDEEIHLDKPEVELRSIVITLSADRNNINYSQAIFGDEVTNPVKWVVSPPKKHLKKLPSIDVIKDLVKNKLKLKGNNLIVNGMDVGKRLNKFEFNSEAIPDIKIVMGEFIVINKERLTSDQPF